MRTICAGEEILDNYGYHYAVMAREERQRKLSSQYYFNCACQSCNGQWSTYNSLSTAAVPVPGTPPDQAKAIIAEYNKSSKQYKKAFDLVLAGKFR